MFALILTVAIVVILFITFATLMGRYKKCPSDQILVIYGKVGKGQSSKCLHGGAAFVVPFIQAYQYMSLSPIQIDIPLKGALSQQNIRVDVPSVFTVGISTEPSAMKNAAERLLRKRANEIEALAKDIIFGQLRVVIAGMTIEDINTDRDKFLENVTSNVESELKKIGLNLINVNVSDIQDESAYIEALGKKAAAEAVNTARVEVAKQDRDGDTGKAEADRQKRVKVAAEDATAVEGENEAKVKKANSDSDRRQKEAEAEKLAVAAENVQKAAAEEESYKAQQKAETVRAEKEKAKLKADEVVQAEIDKEKVEIAAEAEAEKKRREAQGEADAIFAKMEAEARGINQILTKQAEGLKQIVAAAAGNPDKAAMLLIIDKLPELVRTQVEAIKNLKIDKVTVWDGMKNGQADTARFMSTMMGAVPPLQNLFKMAGMELPGFLGKVDGAPAPTEELTSSKGS